MSKGWIKLHRALLDWEWYDDIYTCRLFLHLLLTANHDDRQWRGIAIKKGQKLTSQAKLSEQTGLTRQQVRTSLKRLESTSSITMSTTAQHTVVTVLKWDEYQDSTSELTNSQPTANQQLTTNKNYKNYKNEKEIVPVSLLEKISEHWNNYMDGISPNVDLTKKNKVNQKRAKLIKAIIDTDWKTEKYQTDYSDHEYWEGYIQRLATADFLQWQRENGHLKFDQAMNIDKFTRNLEQMRMNE